MTKEERSEKQELCDKFIDKIEQMFIDFEAEHNIKFTLMTDAEFEHLLNHPINLKELIKSCAVKRNNGLNLYYAPHENCKYIFSQYLKLD